jgi:Domain of unknown function (DUF4349)
MNTAEHLILPEEIMALLDGELSSERAQYVSTHIDMCSQCLESANSLRSVSQSLANWTSPSASADARRENTLFAAARRFAPDQPIIPAARIAAFLRQHWLVSGLSMVLALILLRSLPVYHLYGIGDAVNHTQRRADERTRTVIKSLALSPSVPEPQGIIGGLAGDAANNTDGAPQPSNQDSRPYSELSEAVAGTPQPATRGFEPSAPMIARAVSLMIVAKDFGSSRASLESILARHHGYAATLTASTQQNSARALQASLRIPAAELNGAVAELKSLGRVENETQNGEEVTQQHADLIARLKNSRETERRLQTILEQRTGKIGDVLSVEQEIARVRGEIEQMEAEQESLEHRVSFASVDLTLAEGYKAQIGSPSPALGTRVHNGMVKGYRDAVEMLIGIVLFFAEYGPSSLIWLALLLPVAWFLRRRWLRASAVATSINA